MATSCEFESRLGHQPPQVPDRAGRGESLRLHFAPQTDFNVRMAGFGVKIMVLVATVLLAGRPALADVTVAVAANFATTAQKLATVFTAKTDQQVVIVTGSTGQLYAQIRNGAPYDLFLSADAARIARLETDGALRPAGRKPYALGRLVLFGNDPKLIALGLRQALQSAALRHLAVANPALAPYGAAARQVLDNLALGPELDAKLVMGANVGQAFGFVRSGNAELGLVARGQVSGNDGRWIEVPRDLYSPVRQEAGLLRDTPVSRAFFAFLDSDAARDVIRAAGYDVPACKAEPAE